MCSSKVDLLRQEPNDLTEFHREALTSIKVRDGSGFKTVMGDVALPAGGKYFFVFKIVQGTLIKIGVTSSPDNLEQVSISEFTSAWRLSVTQKRGGPSTTAKSVTVVTQTAQSMVAVSSLAILLA